MHFYYLHTETKDLIHKRFEPENDSPYVKKIWKCDTTNRASIWKIVLEGLALGAKINRVKELCIKWHCDSKDFEEMLFRVKPTELEIQGATLFIEKILNINVDKFWNDFSK